MEEIRFIAGPIVQRYREKADAEREVIRKAEEQAYEAKKRELEAQKQAEEAAKKPEADAEMQDAPEGEDKQ